MPTWTKLILPLLAASALIAYAGDVIGKHLGKKRLSVFGLRPKQTARLFSIGSGVTIMLVTFAVILSLSSDAREAMFSLHAIKRELANLVGEKTQLVASNKKLRDDTARLQRERNAADTAKRQAEVALHQLEGQLTVIRGKLAATQQQLLVARRDLRSTELERDRVGQRTIETSRRLVESEQKLNARATEVARLEREIQRLAISLDSVNQTYIDVLSTRKPLVYEQGEIIASTVLDTGQLNLAAVRDRLVKLLALASEEAVLRGAARISKPRAVFLRDSADLDGRTRDENDQLDDESKKILGLRTTVAAGFDGRAIVDVVARLNSLRGREVPAVLVSYPNELVFRRGDLIAQDTLEGGGKTAALFSRLQNLIQQGRTHAVERQLRPRGSVVYDPATTNDRVFDCLRKLEQTSGRVTVRLLADRDIRSADYLRVRFEAITSAAGE